MSMVTVLRLQHETMCRSLLFLSLSLALALSLSLLCPPPYFFFAIFQFVLLLFSPSILIIPPSPNFRFVPPELQVVPLCNCPGSLSLLKLGQVCIWMQGLCRNALCLGIGLWYSSGYCEMLQSQGMQVAVYFAVGKKNQKKNSKCSYIHCTYNSFLNTLNGLYILLRPGYNSSTYVSIFVPSLGFSVHVSARAPTCTHTHTKVLITIQVLYYGKKNDCIGPAINCSFVQFTLKLWHLTQLG